MPFATNLHIVLALYSYLKLSLDLKMLSCNHRILTVFIFKCYTLFYRSSILHRKITFFILLIDLMFLKYVYLCIQSLFHQTDTGGQNLTWPFWPFIICSITRSWTEFTDSWCTVISYSDSLRIIIVYLHPYLYLYL
jgi:hypothetical protein